METILILAVAVLIIGCIFLVIDTLKWKRLYLEAEAAPSRKLESKSEPKQIKQEKNEPKTAAKTVENIAKSNKADKADRTKQNRELQEAREEIKSLKTKLHGLKGEVKDLKVAEADAPQPIVDSAGLFELREELAQAKAEAIEWKAKAESKPSKEARREEKAVVVEAPRESAPAVASAGTSQNDEAIKRLQTQLEALKKENYKAQDELKTLTDRAKKGGRNSEKERRRADDNDRAYRITKSQLDVTLDRVTYLEGKLAAAGIAVEVQEVPVLTPAPRRATAPIVDVRDAVKEEVAPEPETKIEAAEVAPVEVAPAETEAPAEVTETPAEVEAPAESDGVAEPIVRRSATEPVSQSDLFQAAPLVKETDHGEMQVYTKDEDVLTPPSTEAGEDDNADDSSVDDGWANLE